MTYRYIHLKRNSFVMMLLMTIEYSYYQKLCCTQNVFEESRSKGTYNTW